MKQKKKWEVLNKNTLSQEKFNIAELIQILLHNRGLLTEKEQDTFLHPDIKAVTYESVGIDAQNLKKGIERITRALQKGEEIIVFGDYDVDGIAGTAIIWETLNSLGAKVMPYIPSRVDEGYGLSIIGIENILAKNSGIKLIITVDNGIVANDAVNFANKKGIDVIITDHHVKSEKVPSAQAIVHTTNLCGTGVAWIFSQEIRNTLQKGKEENDYLGLVALATITDLVPLTNANRILLTEGLKVLRTTNRLGIIALCQESGIMQKQIGVYEIGHILGPRLNAMGRIASAMDSLRLLCTKDKQKAMVLAEKLGMTNRERQDVTKNLSLHAIEKVRRGETKLQDLLIVYDQSYEEGVIGLIAGKLVEEFYRPSIVLSLGEKTSKGSARSIAGFNIIEFIRQAEHLLINAGGHPMAAGFTIATENIGKLEKFFEGELKGYLREELFIRIVRIDCELPLNFITQELYDTFQKLQPFGMSNPEPTFITKAKVMSVRQVGKEKNHLSFLLASIDGKSKKNFSAIAFGRGDEFSSFTEGQELEIVYTIDEHVWNNKKSLQLKIKDIQ